MGNHKPKTQATKNYLNTSPKVFQAIVLSLISGYVLYIKPILHNMTLSMFGSVSTCKYEESCSLYTRRMIRTRGTITGLFLGGKRFLTCISL